MSDLNLENIVGFKAVDKNGNERQVTVDEMTELVSARIVSAASEISTFAAAAAAGTDEFEDQLPQSDTFSWLRTLDGSKNPTLTSSSAAAKVLGGLLPNATGNNDGLMSINDKKRMGRRFTKGFKKLVESKVWYNHYVAFIFGASPASEKGVLLAVEWSGRNNINVTRIVGSSSKVKLYLGSNPETDTYELWIGFVGTDAQGSEFIIQSLENIDLYGETAETLPPYLSEVPIS